MCLDAITKRYRPPLAEVTAWGVFKKSAGRLLPECRDWRSGNVRLSDKPLPIDNELKARRSSTQTDLTPTETYTAGFHKYRTRKAARKMAQVWGLVTRKVKLRKVHILGTEDGRDVYVADYMTVLPPEKRRR